jgi:ketol-acid reductoisomerase
MPAKVYTDKDADLGFLKNKTLAVLGFGSQGHSHAMNLRDSGLNVIVGLYKGSKSAAAAKKKGFKVYETAEAVRRADVMLVGIPDMKQASVWEKDIAPNLGKGGKTVLFIHGLSIHYKLIKPGKNVDIAMVAPKGPGHVVRAQYVEGKGVPALIAVQQDVSGKATKTALAWAKGIGGTRAGVIKTSFKEEAETDLFGEQAVLCGGASELVKVGYETLVEAGYQPEMAYFECLHELKLIVDLMVESGISGMRFSISETAKYGDITRGPRVINSSSRKAMREILKEIQSGKFTAQWVKEYKGGLKNYNKLLKKGENHPIEKTGQRLRSLMPWVQKKNIRGADASRPFFMPAYFAAGALPCGVPGRNSARLRKPSPSASRRANHSAASAAERPTPNSARVSLPSPSTSSFLNSGARSAAASAFALPLPFPFGAA